MTKAGAQLVVDKAKVSFSGFVAVSDLTLRVAQGELRCLIGPNGAGKTTALDLICGKTRLATGEVYFQDKPIHRLSEHAIARTGIGRKFQVPSVFRDLSVRDNLHIGRSASPGVLSNLFRFRQSRDKADIERLGELVGLEDELGTPAAHLSHGQTAGMTQQETKKTADLFCRLRGKHTLIVVEHDMGFVRDIAQTISVMHQGKLLAEGTISEIESNQAVRDAYLGSGGIGHA